MIIYIKIYNVTKNIKKMLKYTNLKYMIDGYGIARIIIDDPKTWAKKQSSLGKLLKTMFFFLRKNRF